MMSFIDSYMMKFCEGWRVIDGDSDFEVWFLCLNFYDYELCYDVCLVLTQRHFIFNVHKH